MSGTRAVAGLDTMSPEDTALMNSMRDDGPEPEADLDVAPEATAAPEPGDIDTEIEQTDTPDRTKTVPQQALHAEREKRKAAEAKAQAAELKSAADAARFAERFEMLTQAVQAAAPQQATPAAPEIPDVTTDPIGHFKALYETTQKTLADQQAILTGFQEQQQKAQAVSDLRNWGIQQEVSFEQQEPTYRDAMKFLTSKRHAELELMGIVHVPTRNQLIMQDVEQIAQISRQQGVNYAERLYNIAVERGFTKAPVIPALDAAPDAVARAQRGRDNATTIGTSGAAPPAAMSPERIAAMPEKEFAAYLDKVKQNPAALRQLMGA